jgi:hypothetical protein
MTRPATLVLIPSARCRLSIAANPAAARDLWSQAARAADLAIAFAPPPEDDAPVTWREMDATVRLDWPKGAGRVALVGVLSLSSLGPLVLWDLAHAAPVGGELLLVDRGGILPRSPLDGAYYGGWLIEETGQAPGHRLFRKNAPAPAEADAGLDSWTFGLPMERPNPKVLQRLVERVSGLGLAQAEVLVACPEAHAHLLPAGVQHAATPPGATLTAKKNILAAAAQHPNLCLFHDRLLPPRNFRQAVEAFGDAYPITGFQNLLIHPGDGAIARYSDYHAEFGPAVGQIASMGLDGAPDRRLHHDLLELRQSWRSHFVEASIHEYGPGFYLTGSLYLAKRSVWRLCGQDEAIDWGGLEDVEFGHRAVDAFGIPMRVNPFAFARSDRLRPVVAEGAHHHEADSFESHSLRPGAAAVSLGGPDAAPVFDLTEADYRERLARFSAQWAAPTNLAQINRHIALASLADMQDLARLLIAVLFQCQVRRTEAEVRTFIRAVSGQLLLSAMDGAAETGIVTRVMDGDLLVDELAKSNYLTDLLLTGEKRPLFVATPTSDAERLTGRLLEIWTDPRHGISYPGPFAAFAEAVKAAL